MVRLQAVAVGLCIGLHSRGGGGRGGGGGKELKG